MMEIPLSSFLAFVLAAAALAVVPGPTVTVIIANALRYGVRAGLMNVVGTVSAGIVWVVIAALGLQAAIQVMGVWFDVLRYAGAAYLVWLGYRLITSKGELAADPAATRSDGNFFAQAFMVTMTNPKALVLFGMMIPPFLSTSGNTGVEVMLLGGTFVAIAAVSDSLYAILAGRAGVWLSRSRIRAIEVTSGALLAGGGVWMALRR